MNDSVEIQVEEIEGAEPVEETLVVSVIIPKAYRESFEALSRNRKWSLEHTAQMLLNAAVLQHLRPNFVNQ